MFGRKKQAPETAVDAPKVANVPTDSPSEGQAAADAGAHPVALSPLAAMAGKARASRTRQCIVALLDGGLLLLVYVLLLQAMLLLDHQLVHSMHLLHEHRGDAQYERPLLVAVSELGMKACLIWLVVAILMMILDAALLSARRGSTVGGMVCGVRYTTSGGFMASVPRAFLKALIRRAGAMGIGAGCWWLWQGWLQQVQLALAGGELSREVLEPALQQLLTHGVFLWLGWLGWVLLQVGVFYHQRRTLSDICTGLLPLQRSLLRPL